MKGTFICNIEHRDGRKDIILVDADSIKLRDGLKQPAVHAAIHNAHHPKKIAITFRHTFSFKELQEIGV